MSSTASWPILHNAIYSCLGSLAGAIKRPYTARALRPRGNQEVIQSRDPGIRKIAVRILLAQAAMTVVIAIVSHFGWGSRAGLSALAGGGTGLLANAFMTLQAMRSTSSAAGALGRILLGQFMKVAVTITLFVLAARTGKVIWPAMLVAYAATLVVFWFVPMMQMRMRRTPG